MASINFEPETIRQIDAIRGSVERAPFVRSLLKRALQEQISAHKEESE